MLTLIFLIFFGQRSQAADIVISSNDLWTLSQAFVNSFTNSQDLITELTKAAVLGSAEKQGILDFLKTQKFPLEGHWTRQPNAKISIAFSKEGKLKTLRGKFLKNEGRPLDLVFISTFQALQNERSTALVPFLFFVQKANAGLLEDNLSSLAEIEHFSRSAWAATVFEFWRGINTATYAGKSILSQLAYWSVFSQTRNYKKIEDVICYNGNYFLVGKFESVDFDKISREFSDKYSKLQVQSTEKRNAGWSEGLYSLHESNAKAVNVMVNGIALTSHDLKMVWPGSLPPACSSQNATLVLKSLRKIEENLGKKQAILLTELGKGAIKNEIETKSRNAE